MFFRADRLYCHHYNLYYIHAKESSDTAGSMKSHYAYIFIGGGYFACGAAVSNGNSLVVEPSIYPGSDFAAGFHPGTDYAMPQHPLAFEFYDELIRRKVMSADLSIPLQ